MAEKTITNLRGPAARITGVSAVSVAAGSPAYVTMTGPDQNRGFAFGIPQGLPGLPGVNGVENDAAMALLLGNQSSETRGQLVSVLDESQPSVPAAWYGMSTSNSGAQNKSALIAAVTAANGRQVQITRGLFDVDKISEAEFGGNVARIVGVGARVLAAKRWELGDAQWQTDGPEGTVLRCSSTLAPGEEFIHIGSSDDTTSTSMHDLALLGQGTGIGLKVGQAVGGTGGGFPVRWNYGGVVVANFDIGMTHTGENGVLIAPYIVGCGDGFYAGYPFNGNTIIGINVERVKRSAIRLDHAMTNVFMGGVLQGSYPELATILIENSSMGNVFEGIYCENYAAKVGSGSPHVGELYEVWIGRASSGGPNYGNRLRNMHWGSTASVNKIVVYGAYFTEISQYYAPGDTLAPSVYLDSGYGHEVYGMFPFVGGAGVSQSTVRRTMGVLPADVVEKFGWNLATPGYMRVGSAVTLPDPVTSGVGAIHRGQQEGLIMDSDGSQWEPLASRISAFTSGAGGVTDGAAVPTWTRYTHIKFTGATGFKLWTAASVSAGRAYFVRNGKASGDLTISVQTGGSINGTVNGTLAIPAGQGMWFVVQAGVWTSY